MKKVSLLLMLFIFGLAFGSKAQTMPADKVIKMDKEEYNLGKIKHNEPLTFFMEFTNIYTKPVVVENVMVGCGCTVAEKPAAPVMPGKKGKIKVGYNAAANGTFKKDVTIKLVNTTPKTVWFTGQVVE